MSLFNIYNETHGLWYLKEVLNELVLLISDLSRVWRGVWAHPLYQIKSTSNLGPKSFMAPRSLLSASQWSSPNGELDEEIFELD